MKLSFDPDLNRFGGEGQNGGGPKDETNLNLLIIVNVRLGLSNIPRIYFNVIMKHMRNPYFVGLVGGKPNLAYYFVGSKSPD